MSYFFSHGPAWHLTLLQIPTFQSVWPHCVSGPRICMNMSRLVGVKTQICWVSVLEWNPSRISLCLALVTITEQYSKWWYQLYSALTDTVTSYFLRPNFDRCVVYLFEGLTGPSLMRIDVEHISMFKACRDMSGVQCMCELPLYLKYLFKHLNHSYQMSCLFS